MLALSPSIHHTFSKGFSGDAQQCHIQLKLWSHLVVVVVEVVVSPPTHCSDPNTECGGSC